MATQWCSLKRENGVVTSVVINDKPPRRPRVRGITPLLKLLKRKPRDVDLRHADEVLREQRKKEGIILRGRNGYFEDQTDYCSSDPVFEAVHAGLVDRPSWERLNFSVLLKLWHKYTARQRHRRAKYAFDRNGNPTPEYKDPLNVYANSRSHLVAQYQDERRRAARDLNARRHAEELLEAMDTDSGYGSDTDMGQVAVHFVDFQAHASDPWPGTNQQEDADQRGDADQQDEASNSRAIAESGHVSDTDDERPVAPEHQFQGVETPVEAMDRFAQREQSTTMARRADIPIDAMDDSAQQEQSAIATRRVEIPIEAMGKSAQRKQLATMARDPAKTRPRTKSMEESQGRVSKHRHSLATKNQVVSKEKLWYVQLEEQANLQDLCDRRRHMERGRAVSVDPERLR